MARTTPASSANSLVSLSLARRWLLLSRIEVNTGGRAWHLDGLYSFVEQWTGSDPMDVRGAVYGPGWTAGLAGEGGWSQVKDASFSYGTPENHLHVNAYEADGGVGIETGGDVVKTAEIGQAFVYPDTEVPQLLLDFEVKIACLEAAGDKDGIEGCLAAEPEEVVEEEEEEVVEEEEEEVVVEEEEEGEEEEEVVVEEEEEEEEGKGDSASSTSRPAAAAALGAAAAVAASLV
jgi:hypothetical protein